MKITVSKKVKTILGYIVAFILIFAGVLFLEYSNFSDFFTSMENKTFDLRQSVLVKSGARKVNKDIVLITVDNASYEYLLAKYGEWPLPRSVYANLVNYLEKQNPKAIAFDLMFIKSVKSKTNDDLLLTNSIVNNKNVFTSMNFDNQSVDVRKPVKLDDKFSINIKNNSKIDFSQTKFINCRPILSQIMQKTSNIGLVNISRAEDGIVRKIPPFLTYQDNFYPHLSLLVGQKALDNTDRNFLINKNSTVEIAGRTIPLDEDGGAILNWYGDAGKTFQEIPIYKVVKAMNDGENLDFNFENKIIYIGTTAVSLYDIKSVPISKTYPGIEIHTTFVNNFIDNSFIKKASLTTNIILSLLLATMIVVVIFKTSSTLVALLTTFVTPIGYTVFAYYMMKFFNIWLAIVVPVTTILFAFVVVYIVKYLMKSRDFEHQYKLATTDGLTELFNHRYFQEQMIMQIANAKRYNTNFSIIMTDIDYFKKFNDTFGHQSGDAVLKQVASKFKKNVRSSDFVCRYGGEEMTIILPNADREEVLTTAQKLCDLIAEKPFKLANNQESKVTISLGVATFPMDGETPAEIIATADNRLYYAKEHGRNQVGK